MKTHISENTSMDIASSEPRPNIYDKVSKRRKSSFYRPKFHSYPQFDLDCGTTTRIILTNPVVDEDTNMEPHSKIEMLPVGILETIFSRLATKDLLSLCITSKLLYLPAAMILYRKIVICHDKRAYDSIRSCTTNLPRNVGTLVHMSQLSQLMGVIMSNAKIASNVKSLVFYGNSNVDSIHTAMLANAMKVLALNTLITPHTGIKDLCYMAQVASANPFINLNTLSISAGSDVATSAIELPNLVNLEVTYTNDSLNQRGFVCLARMLGTGGGLKSLRTLQFRETEDDEDNKLNILNSLNSLTLESKQNAVWIYFFVALVEESVLGTDKLAITSLGLDGYVGNSGYLIANLIDKALDLSCLRDLQLNIKESSHHEQPHTSTETTLLTALARVCPNLSGLAVNPTYDCLNCQHTSLIQALQLYTNKILDFHLIFESPTIDFVRQINHTIITHQPQLRNLRILDKSRQVNDQIALLKCMNSKTNRLSYFEYGKYYKPMISAAYFGDVFLYELDSLRYSNHHIIVNDYTLRFIHEAADHGLTEFLKYYLSLSYSPFIVSGFDLVNKARNLEHLDIFDIDLLITRHTKVPHIYYIGDELHEVFGPHRFKRIEIPES